MKDDKMENEYAIKVKNLDGVLNPSHKVKPQRFIVSFSNYILPVSSKNRTITTCCIIELQLKKIYSGATIKNTNDFDDVQIARKWAYKRAVFYLWVVWQETRKITCAFEPFWQLFEKALTENKIYLAKRKGKKKMDEKLRIVKPYGYLYCGLEQYYLLSPVPVPGDNWERDGTYRFVGVPVTSAAIEEKGTEVYNVYGYARHIVTNSFTIEYQYDMEEIHIPILDEIDLTTMEKKENDQKSDDFPF